MKPHEHIVLKRDCPAVQIPSGEAVKLAAGATVTVTQSLGGSFTVMTDHGAMVRIAGKDAEALGLTVPSASAHDSARSVEQQVWEQLRTCYDPEIPVDFVELGLVYHCQVASLPDGEHRVEVKLTLTAPGCGMGPVLKGDVESKLSAIPGVAEVAVDLVWEPPWDTSKMSEAAKLQLGMV